MLNYVIVMLCFYGGVAVLDLDSHPNPTKGPEPRTLRMSLDLFSHS